MPSGHAVFVSDLEHGGGHEHVLGVTPSSALLGNLASRHPVQRALDLGTGCGIQAYLLAKHAEQIVATDVNERALDFARFNLALNGAAGVELRSGSWLEPVAGERFDLVVCNPPFVISPESRYTYRDSGLPADELVRRLVADLPSLLEEGGTAQLLLSWIVRAGESWADPVARWLEGNGCDALLLRYRLDSPRGYAEHWNRGDDAAIESWVDWYEELGAEAIAYGALALRRRGTAPQGFVTAEVASDRLEPGGDHIHRILEAQALLAEATDDDLLDRGFALTHDHLLEQALVVRDGEWEVEAAVLRLQEGLGFEAGIDAFTALAARAAGCRDHAARRAGGGGRGGWPPARRAPRRRAAARARNARAGLSQNSLKPARDRCTVVRGQTHQGEGEHGRADQGVTGAVPRHGRGRGRRRARRSRAGRGERARRARPPSPTSAPTRRRTSRSSSTAPRRSVSSGAPRAATLTVR